MIKLLFDDFVKETLKIDKLAHFIKDDLYIDNLLTYLNNEGATNTKEALKQLSNDSLIMTINTMFIDYPNLHQEI